MKNLTVTETVITYSESLSLHRAFRSHLMGIPTKAQCAYIKFHIKTLKINQLVFLKCEFSKEQYSSLKMILGSKHAGPILSVLMRNFMYVH